MTDAEVVATFMEPKPEAWGDYTDWWTMTPDEGDASWVPRRFSLDSLREVEARLTEERRKRYEAVIVSVCVYAAPPPVIDPRPFDLIHASAKDKLAALAQVLRVENPPCKECGGTGRVRLNNPVFDTDSADERRDARDWVVCPGCRK